MQYTIRNIPKRLDELLRQKAHREKKSLNAVVVRTLEEAAGLSGKATQKRDLSDIVGHGKGLLGPEFDEVMKDFERIDEEDWK